MKFTILVTSKCNLKCKYCYEGHEKDNKNMTYRIANKTIDFIMNSLKNSKDNVPLYIVFHGGEPLLNFDLIKYIHNSILEKVTNRDVIFDMTTNGTIMNEEIKDYIKMNIKNISISIDGTKYSHDLNRVFENGLGSYDKVILNSKKLLDEEIELRARMTYNSKTISELYEGVISIAEKGFKYIAPAIDRYDSRWEKEHVYLLKDAVSKLIEYQKIHPDKYISLTNLSLLVKKKGDCFGGINSYCIDERGNIYPCTDSVGKKDFIIGHVNNTGILDSKINELCEIYISENEGCKGCSRYEYCSGTRCKILNKLSTGEYGIPPAIVCATEKIHIESIKKLATEF